MILYFKNPTFKEGRNVTVRRGVKWDVANKEEVYIADANVPTTEKGPTKVLHTVDIETKVVPFDKISQYDFDDEHDPNCRSWLSLLRAMKEMYPGFSRNEIVTVVSFEIK